MKVLIDENLTGTELFAALVANKTALVQQKKSLIKKTDPVSSHPVFYNVKGTAVEKTAIGQIAPDATSIRVKVVANTALWMDSQSDVLLPDCWKKSIAEKQGLVPHLKDHTYEIDSELGDVVRFYSQDISLTDLGLNKTGSTQALVFETDIKKEYDEKAFTKYKTGKVKQHSIGLQYVNIQLAVNDSDYKDEFAVWNKYYGSIINKDAVDQNGYFWAVGEIKLLENSAVLFGSNTLTPTLEVSAKGILNVDTDTQPLEGTVAQPLEAFDWSHAIKETTFIKI